MDKGKAMTLDLWVCLMILYIGCADAISERVYKKLEQGYALWQAIALGYLYLIPPTICAILLLKALTERTM